MVFEVGHVAEHMVAVLEGAIEIVFTIGGQLVPSVTQRQGTSAWRIPKSVSICCADPDLARIDQCAIWPSSFCIC